MSYLVLAFYRFVPLDDPHGEVQKHKDFFEGKDLTGRIYLSEEGINAQLSGITSDALAYLEWLQNDERFATLRINSDEYHEHIFPRMTVKYRRQLVALDETVDTKEGGVHLSPAAWKEALENERDICLLDVRNRYEWEVGHFEGSTLPPLEKFRSFPAYARALKEQVGTQKKIMMCCTGGIRCELFSALLKKVGFENVYQLEGGILNYGKTEGSAHWQGKLFVFDDRLAISIDGKEKAPISFCHHCSERSDTYYNCANMDCNELFLSCPTCLQERQGCCSPTCQAAPRLRPLSEYSRHKPFRRKHLISI